MSAYRQLLDRLPAESRRWLVTGGAGFIGSHLAETLLKHGQQVAVLDNFSTGHASNLEALKAELSDEQLGRLRVIDADLRDPDVCRKACAETDHILHQAALGSVPRSIEDPAASHASNVTATVNLFTAAREAGVRRVVYASSSSVYGDEPTLPKVEDRTGALLSPYAATKAICEIYATVFARCYGLETVGLRYFNVFGPRQDPEGPYAAVIPKWLQAMLAGEPIVIHGDGSTSRDFTFVANAVQANLLAATVESPDAVNRAYNVAIGERASLGELARLLREGVLRRRPDPSLAEPEHTDFRAGDIHHSLADISAAARHLGYQPEIGLADGLEATIDWFAANAAGPARES